MQMRLFDEKRKSGEIEFEVVSETGRKFKDEYKTTPVTTVDAHKESSGTLWFNSKYYRGNLYFADGKIMMRDMFIFNENYKERYFDKVEDSANLYFDNLPLIDCFRWSNENVPVEKHRFHPSFPSSFFPQGMMLLSFLFPSDNHVHNQDLHVL